MSKYGSTASSMYLILEALVQDAVSHCGKRRVLIERLMTALDGTATEMITLVGLLNLADSYIEKDSPND